MRRELKEKIKESAITYPKKILNSGRNLKVRAMEEVFMKWRPDFNLGIVQIDEEHKKIVELINKLNSAFMHDEADSKIGEILNEMAEYANYHFKNEEELFSAKNYPFTEEHKALHKNFINKVNEYKVKYEAGQPVTFRVLNFLRTWLTNHILDADREYVVLLK